MAVQVLGAETELLKLNRALHEAYDGHREAKNVPSGLPTLEGCRRVLDLLPAFPLLDRLAADWERAINAKPDPRVNRILVGLLFDSFPQAVQGQPEIFVEAILHDLAEGGFPPVTVAEALQKIRRTSKFRPTVAEILEQCADTRERHRRKPAQVAFLRSERERSAAAFERELARCAA